jgi:UrcA family protein
MKSLATFTSIIVLSLATINVANADPQSAHSLTVQFGDLDLNKPRGVEALFKRIKNAAERVCSDLEGRRLTEKRLHSECVAMALSTAVTRVDRPVLSQYLVERSAKPRKVSVPLASKR